MRTLTNDRIGSMLTKVTNDIQKTWGWLLALGIVQILAGMLAVGFAFGATYASVMTFGFLLLIAAGAQTVAAICARNWSGFFLFVQVGILYAIAGIMTIQHPVLAAEGLTLMLAATLLAGGVFRIVVAVAERFPSWGWVLWNGIITTLLGLAIWQQWPASGLWVLGTFIGIDLIVNGMTWSLLGVAVRNGLARLVG